jgi:hypothetical protein
MQINDFRNDFIKNIAKGDGAEFIRIGWFFLFMNQRKKSFIQRRGIPNILCKSMTLEMIL